jgi:hypothetical protein
VLDREGSRDPAVPRLGPLKGPAEQGVEFVAGYIVQSHAKLIVTRLRALYTRRESQCPPELPERRLLARARIEADRIAPGFTGGGGGLPTIIAGGAAVPLLASAARYVTGVNFADSRVLLAALALLFVLFFVASWVLLQGAAVAHRRTRLIMAQPLALLYEMIGHCGNPPRDRSTRFATVAIALTSLAWLTLPIGGAIAVWG